MRIRIILCDAWLIGKVFLIVETKSEFEHLIDLLSWYRVSLSERNGFLHIEMDQKQLASILNLLTKEYTLEIV